MHPKYKEAEEAYQGKRDAVFDFMWQKWSAELNSPTVDLRIFPIDNSALQQVENVWGLAADPNRPPIFEWRSIYNQVRTTPRRLDMSIWNGSLLTGLVVGKASRGNPAESSDPNITIHFMQAAPKAIIGDLRGSVARIALDAAEAYAMLLDRKSLYLRSPLPEVVPYYENHGFSVVKRNKGRIYMGKKV